MNNKQKEFIKELKNLLSKYKAEIGWKCDDSTDFYGIIDDRMYIHLMGEKKDIEIKSMYIDGYCLNEVEKENEK